MTKGNKGKMSTPLTRCLVIRQTASSLLRTYHPGFLFKIMRLGLRTRLCKTIDKKTHMDHI